DREVLEQALSLPPRPLAGHPPHAHDAALPAETERPDLAFHEGRENVHRIARRLEHDSPRMRGGQGSAHACICQAEKPPAFDRAPVPARGGVWARACRLPPGTL